MPQCCIILFLAANPAELSRLRLDHEIREIETKIRATEYRGAVKIISSWAVRASDLQQALLEHRPHVVHFSSHGSRNAEIILEDRHGRQKPVGQRALAGLFKALPDRLELVVLNACHSAQQAQAIAQTINCVVGIKEAIGDSTARAFAAAFYRALGFGRPILTAFELGRNALELEGLPGSDLPELTVRKGVDASKIRLVLPSGRNSPESDRSPWAVDHEVIALWQERLTFLQGERAITASPSQKFELTHRIEEAEKKLRELGSGWTDPQGESPY